MIRWFPLSIALAASALLLTGLLAGSRGVSVFAQQQNTPTSVPTSEQPDGSGVQNLPPIEGKLNPPQYPNMDSNLNLIAQQVETGRFTAQVAAANAPVSDGGSVAVTLYITEGYADAIAVYLESNGASPRNIGADYIEAYIPVSLLAEASEQEGVIRIRTIIPPQPAQGEIASDGLVAHGVPAWYLAGVRGQGVKIGIIDIGFEGFRELMGTELPTRVQARCYTGIGVFSSSLSDCEVNGDVHGTAVTETVFDIASRATYYISNPHSQGDLQTAVNWMIEQNVDVINMSLGWPWDGPGDGTSPSSTSPLKSVDIAVANGITWVNAAGNHAEHTWFGPFANPDSASDSWHNFAGSDECNEVVLEAGQRFVVQLRWNDEWGGATRDLDLYLLNSARVTAASSENAQSGGAADDPFEYLEYTPASSGSYCLAVSHNGGAAPSWIQLQDFEGVVKFEHYTTSGSILNPAESTNSGLLAVGATFRNITQVQPFSSQGPTPGGRIKPDVVGANWGDTVSNRSAENPEGFFKGTSAASSHVAGLAALVKQRFPRHTPHQVTQYLKNNAFLLGAVPNNTLGYGFPRLPASEVATPTPSVPPPLLGATSHRIAFASNRNAPYSGGRFDSYVMNADGSDVTYLFEYPGGKPIWSPDGRRIAFESYRSGNFDIFVMNADGTGQTNLTNHPGDDREPSWSPAGRRIVFESYRDGPGTDIFGRNAEIYVMNADGTGQTKLTNNPASDRYPSWSPDGRRIAFYSTRDDDFCGDLYVMNIDGSGKTSLTRNVPFGGWSASWSPDGRRIAFVTGCGQNRQHGGFQIYVMDADGSNPTPLTDAPGDDEYPSWSPDGRLILFQSSRDNYVQIGQFIAPNREIYVMNADGTGQTNLTNDPAWDRLPDWLPITVAEPTPEPTPTPTPDPTPEPTSTPETTPSQSPEPTPAEQCIQALTESTVAGTWESNCGSAARDGRYARFYSFTLTEESEVTVTLTSDEDTYLYIREGEGTDGTILYENDDIRQYLDLNSRVAATLAAGTYTIEATTYEAGVVGEFMLTVTGLPATDTPEPTPTASPEPTPGDPCIEAITSSTVTGTWESSCESSAREGSYARFYTFTLTEDSNVTITLTSEVDTFLYIREGEGRGGTILHENDDIQLYVDLNSRIVETFSSGTYTVEATTYDAGTVGEFTLTVSGLPAAVTNSQKRTGRH